MKKFCTLILIISGFHHTSAQTRNIKLIDLVAGDGSAGNPTVAINHKDPDNWVAGVSLQHLVYTKDAGKTWSKSKPTSSLAFYGDPALISDGKGGFHYLYTAGAGGKNQTDIKRDRMVFRTSSDGGNSWEAEASYGNLTSYAQVRPRPSVQKGSLYLTWTRYDRDAPKDSCQSNILFSESSNDGKKWSEPVQINQTPGDCQEDAQAMQGAAPILNPEGKLFVAWSNHGIIYLDRSFDGGRTWLNNDLSIVKQSEGGPLSIPGIQPCFVTPVLTVDNSFSYFRGSLYLVWADQSKGENDTDIWFSRSTNRGDFWSPAVRINKDSVARHQFLPSMVVDEMTGIIYIVYYDRRSYNDLQTDAYLAYSTDGGNNFKELKISESPFILSAERPIANQPALAAFKGVIIPVWTRSEDGKISVWASPLNQGDLIKKDEAPRIQSLQQLQQQRKR